MAVLTREYTEAKPLRQDKLFLLILLAGVLIRFLFLLVGSKYYYTNGSPYENGDSNSYILSFTNLINHGKYAFDFLEPDSAFGRLPGYPFFYGIHHILFGAELAPKMVALTQTVLDCISIVLVFKIGRKLLPANNIVIPYVAALLYAFYPFIIVWITMVGTELFATFLTLLWLNTLLSKSRHWSRYFILGIEAVLLFYVREFLGIVLAVTGLYLLSQEEAWSVRIRNCVLVGAGFGMLYIWWPVRNYVFQHRVVLVKPQRAGYANYNTDMVGFLNWVHSWSNESTYWLEQSLQNPNPPFPDDIFSSPQEKAKALGLVKRANECGSSFYLYKNRMYNTPVYYDTAAMHRNADYMIQCNDEISNGFEQLRSDFKQRNPVAYYTRVPLQNITKVFFKSSKVEYGTGAKKSNIMLTVLFGYRTLLLLLGLLGLIKYYRAKNLQPIIIFYGFMTVFLCFFFRQLEMRYLIQGDVLMLFPAALILSDLLKLVLPSKWLGVEPARVH